MAGRALIVIVLAVTAAGCASGSHQAAAPSGPAAASNSTTSATDPTTTDPTTSTTATTPTTVTTTAPPTTAPQLPIAVQSDSAMVAAGNHGPTSSVLVPATCTLDGTTVTATGSYQGGVPEVYHRYGDVVELYVFSAPASGYPDGVQVASLSQEQAPQLGGSTWRVRVPVQTTPAPARCLVAAQPTHDFEGAPSDY